MRSEIKSGRIYDTPGLFVMHLSEKDGMHRDATSYNNPRQGITGKLGAAGLYVSFYPFLNVIYEIKWSLRNHPHQD
jgi:hypothetical protein